MKITIKKWVGVTGTWRLINAEVEKDVRTSIKDVVMSGGGIVTGGAMGVDYFAVDEALRVDPSGRSIKVVLPSTLEAYITHIQKWADGYSSAGDADITSDDGNRLILQLNALSTVNPEAIIEKPDIPSDRIDQKAYFDRNSDIVDLSQEIYAFQVNKSAGTQDTIDKAEKKGLPISIHKQYRI